MEWWKRVGVLSSEIREGLTDTLSSVQKSAGGDEESQRSAKGRKNTKALRQKRLSTFQEEQEELQEVRVWQAGHVGLWGPLEGFSFYSG